MSYEKELQIPKELVLPLPIEEISEYAKKNHVPYWQDIQKEVQRVVKDNQEKIEDFLTNSMLKLMNEDVSLNNINESTLKEFTKKLDYLNSKFKYLNEYFESLSSNDQRSLLLPFINSAVKSLTNYKKTFKINLISKTKWNLNDSIIYSYYLLYLDNIEALRELLEKATNVTIQGRLNNIKGLIFWYEPIILIYLMNKPLPNEVLLKRIAELRSNINPIGIYPVEPKLDEMVETISSLPPILDE